jgi:hypothetical protein
LLCPVRKRLAFLRRINITQPNLLSLATVHHANRITIRHTNNTTRKNLRTKSALHKKKKQNSRTIQPLGGRGAILLLGGHDADVTYLMSIGAESTTASAESRGTVASKSTTASRVRPLGVKPLKT